MNVKVMREAIKEIDETIKTAQDWVTDLAAARETMINVAGLHEDDDGELVEVNWQNLFAEWQIQDKPAMVDFAAQHKVAYGTLRRKFRELAREEPDPPAPVVPESGTTETPPPGKRGVGRGPLISDEEAKVLYIKWIDAGKPKLQTFARDHGLTHNGLRRCAERNNWGKATLVDKQTRKPTVAAVSDKRKRHDPEALKAEWIKLGLPPFAAFAKQKGINPSTIYDYAAKGNWGKATPSAPKPKVDPVKAAAALTRIKGDAVTDDSNPLDGGKGAEKIL